MRSDALLKCQERMHHWAHLVHACWLYSAGCVPYASPTNDKCICNISQLWLCGRARSSLSVACMMQGCLYKPMDMGPRGENVQEMARQLDVLETYITGPYILGEAMCHADAAIFPTLVCRSCRCHVLGQACCLSPQRSASQGHIRLQTPKRADCQHAHRVTGIQQLTGCTASRWHAWGLAT